jgi:hypothetical protein
MLLLYLLLGLGTFAFLAVLTVAADRRTAD